MAEYVVTPLAEGKLQLEESAQDEQVPLVLDAEQVLALRRVLQNPLHPRFATLAVRFRYLASIVQELPVENTVQMDERLSSIASTASYLVQDAQRLAEQAEAYRLFWKGSQ